MGKVPVEIMVVWGVVGSFVLGAVFWFVWQRRKIRASVCGHLTRVKDQMTAFGETIIRAVPLKDGTTEYCHRCLETMAIRCAWCEEPIFIGDPVRLSVSTHKGFQLPLSKDIRREQDHYVGCMRWECAEEVAYEEKVWSPPGEVHEVPSAETSPFKLWLHRLHRFSLLKGKPLKSLQY